MSQFHEIWKEEVDQRVQEIRDRYTRVTVSDSTYLAMALQETYKAAKKANDSKKVEWLKETYGAHRFISLRSTERRDYVE